VLGAAVCSVIVGLVIFPFLPDYGDAPALLRAASGTVVLDRHGRVLRILPDSRGEFRLWTRIEEIPECLKQAVIAVEDQRFLHHPGIDPIATVRALYSNITSGRIVSGASTITQQVVRLIHPRPRTYPSKIIEAVEALKMESQLSKQRILELYLNLSPMGGNIRGVGLAARLYFGKDISRINTAEAAVLAALPRSPSRLNPRKLQGRKRVLAEKDKTLKKMASLGLLPRDRLRGLTGDTVRFTAGSLPGDAPHFTDYVLARAAGKRSTTETTLDLDLQHTLEEIVRSHRDRLARLGITQVAALILDVQRGEVRAMMGSFGYEKRGQGYNNGVFAVRGAGSTLKPFLYALALDRGYTAFSEIPDTFRSYATPRGEYLPLNADRRSYGPVTMRTALGNSLNISAIKVLKEIGTDQFHRLLTRVEILRDPGPTADRYGLGMAVGNVETSLYRLVRAYATLARGGLPAPTTVLKGGKRDTFRVFSEETSYIVSNMLADPTARLLTFGNPDYFHFGFPLSLKTGTSSNYRDAWLVGYTSEHVIGLWAGNFDGSPTAGASGSRACGPILKEIVNHLYRSGPPAPFRRPERVKEISVCWMSGKPASPRCRYTMKELAVEGTCRGIQCDLPHESDGVVSLGAPYARWVFRREMEQGVGRYRLSAREPRSVPRERREDRRILPVNAPRPIGRTSRIGIVHPHEGDRFVFSAHEENLIRFRAVADPLAPFVVWLVDGVETARTPPPYEFFRALERGRHVIDAVTPGNDGARVTIRVE
jgi:penicillin-binding protein 1C